MAPDGKDVVDVSPPDEGLHVGIVQKSSLQLGHKEVSIGGDHPYLDCNSAQSAFCSKEDRPALFS